MHCLVFTDTHLYSLTKVKSLPCKPKMAPLYVFTRSMLSRRLSPLNGCPNLNPMESISLNSFVLLEYLAMLLTSKLVINC